MDGVGEDLVLLRLLEHALEPVREVEPLLGVEDRELLLDAIVKSVASSNRARAASRSRLWSRAMVIGSSQVEVERVKQADGGARRWNGDLGGTSRSCSVVEDHPYAGLDEAVGDLPGGVSGTAERRRRLPPS
ncbi:MAG: hypothetical protein U0R51_03090 [Solirubrobacterales bacterium]